MVEVSARESSSSGRAWLLRTLTCALLAAGALVAADAPARAQGEPVVLAVWALADDDTPVSGGRVRVYASESGRLLRQTNGRRQERTYRAGTALLEFSRLPDEFTVEVAGGRTGGPRLRGAFRAVERHYRSGEVVHVNPVTTLIAADVAAHRQRDLPITSARARRKIYHLLRIPRWQDGADLRNSDRYFDGDAYLRAARKAGGVAALNRALVRQELRPGDRPRRFRVASARAAGVDWLALLAGPPAALAKEAFKTLGILAAKKIGGLAAEKAGNAALGWVLAAFGFGDVLKDQDMLEIKNALSALGQQVTRLQNDLKLAGFSTLVHLTDTTIGKIDHASSQLALLANITPTDTTKRAFTQTIVDYIGANLLDAPAILNRSLGDSVPLSDNLVKSASRLVAQRGRFFDSQSSADVRSVYDYFVAYEVKLAVLLTEYWHAKPETYSPATVAASLAGVEANVNGQAGSLKPDVPNNAVVDTKYGVMWTRSMPPTPQAVDLHTFAEIVNGRRRTFHLKQTAGPRGVAGVPFGDWWLPNLADYARLIEGWSGKNPAAWLETQAHMSKSMLDVSRNQMWARDGFRLVRGTWDRLDIDVFDLDRGGSSGRGSIIWFFADGWKGDFSDAKAGLMFHRALTAGETYWWGN